MNKPLWLNKKLEFSTQVEMKRLLRGLNLHTVCEEASCPNISECFSKKIATFLILGDTCTRNCSFCGIRKGKPLPVDKEEPDRVAKAVKKLALKYVVITSVTRDDLKNGGADIFYNTVLAIKKILPGIKIETLIPDFNMNFKAIEHFLSCGPDIISHNVETVPRLYPSVRSMSDYNNCLRLLAFIKKFSGAKTKSGLMLGLGEKKEEVLKVLEDLRKENCDFLSIGQYLPPDKKHYPVKEYIKPEMFDFYKKQAISMGFKFE
jgi:lipoyl synthase